MDQQVFEQYDQEILNLFELFDWWQPSRLEEELDFSPDRSKYLTKLRKEFKKHALSDQGPLSEDQKQIASIFSSGLKAKEYKLLQRLLPQKIGGEKFTYVDLFAGIGGIGKPFADIGGRCALTCEWDDYAQRTYKANWSLGANHQFVSDIKTLTQPVGENSEPLKGNGQVVSIKSAVPDHDVLLAGFPCQPFSIAGVSKKNALNRAHGFECEDQGQLFFDICRILSAKQPAIAVLENVKNLKSHNKGTTFNVIMDTLTNLQERQKLLFGENINKKINGYWIANLSDSSPDPKIIDGARFIPQHRERVVLVCIRKDLVESLNLESKIDLRNIEYPKRRRTLVDVLDPNSHVPEKYTLTPKLWEYLENYAMKHKAKGNGFGYGIVERNSKSVTRTLSARYFKDGSEILISQKDVGKRPRRLTPQECARLMGFSKSKRESFNIPVSDTRGYKQFGNSVVVPVFEAIAALLEPHIETIIQRQKEF